MTSSRFPALLGMVVLISCGALSPADDKAPAVSGGAQKALDQSSLADSLAREHQLLWQKAVATYKAAEKRIRTAIVKEDFAGARRLMDFARQTIELNRRYATPAAEYATYAKRADALAAFIDDENRLFDEDQIRIQQEEIRNRRDNQIQLVEENKRRQIEQLMDRAAELRKERKLDQAIQVLGQVLAIDANNDQAAWMRETLEDLAQNVRDKRAVRDRGTEMQDLFIENDEVGIPYHENMTYPKNWLEITAKRGDTAGVTESKENQEVRKKLSRVAPEIKFDALEFSEVIDKLIAFTGLNIVPSWPAMEALGIEKDAEVSLRLSHVSFEKALELILIEVGAGEVELAYEIDDGVIRISTKEDLSRRTLTLVYNIKDLLISVPTFRGPQIQIANIGQDSGQQQGGLGGGRFIEGGGQGGGGGGQGNFLTDDGNDDEENQDDPVEPIIELIQETIDPESWREAGGNVGSISSLNQQLIVTQTSTAHAQLRDLLREAE